MTEVAKRYKVSDVAIHKVCKSLNVPTPPLGYWAKLRAGKPVNMTPLPLNAQRPKKEGVQTGISPQLRIPKNPLGFLSEEDRSVVLTVASQVILPDENERMHSKIVAHRKTIAEWKRENKHPEKGHGTGATPKPVHI